MARVRSIGVSLVDFSIFVSKSGATTRYMTFVVAILSLLLPRRTKRRLQRAGSRAVNLKDFCLGLPRGSHISTRRPQVRRIYPKILLFSDQFFGTIDDDQGTILLHCPARSCSRSLRRVCALHELGSIFLGGWTTSLQILEKWRQTCCQHWMSFSLETP